MAQRTISGMSRVDIYNKMRELGIKHYIVSASRITNDGKEVLRWEYGFAHCHYSEESFEAEIKRLENNCFNFFDVIHLH